MRDSQVKTNSDHAKHECTTRSQELLREALLRRLQIEGIATVVHENVRFAMRTNANQGSKYCVRAPDLALIKHGLIIEDDGSAHDNLDKRCRRDNSREHDYGRLGFAVLRIAKSDVYDPERLSKLLNDVIALIRQAEARPDFLKQYALRRQRILRARRAYKRINPDYDFGITLWPKGHKRHRQPTTSPRPHPRRSGALYFIGRKPIQATD